MGEAINSGTPGVTDLRTRTLITVCCATFAAGLLGSSINIALPSIGHELNIGAATLPWITTAYYLASATLLLPGGRAGDIWGQRRIFTYGLVILFLASIGCVFTNSETMLILLRAIQGLGNSLLIPASAVIVIAAYPPRETGKALGIYMASIYLGLTLGPLIGGVLTEHLGWRSLFLFNFPLLIISFVILWQLRKVPDQASGGHFDTVGALFSGPAIFLIIFGLTQVPAPQSLWLMVVGAACVAGFIWWEKRAKFPLLKLELFSNNRIFVFSKIAALIGYAATIAISLIMSLYLQYIQGFSPQTAGLILAVLPLVQSIFSPLTGRLSDRIDPRNLATAGMILTTIGLGFLYFIGQGTSIIYILIVMAEIGLGMAIFVSPNTTAIMISVPPSAHGIASAAASLSRQIGAMLGLAIVTVVFSLLIGEVEITPQYYPAFLSGTRAALGIFTLLCFVGIFTSFARGKRKISAR